MLGLEYNVDENDIQMQICRTLVNECIALIELFEVSIISKLVSIPQLNLIQREMLTIGNRFATVEQALGGIQQHQQQMQQQNRQMQQQNQQILIAVNELRSAVGIDNDNRRMTRAATQGRGIRAN